MMNKPIHFARILLLILSVVVAFGGREVLAQGRQGCVYLKKEVSRYSKELEAQIVMQRHRILPFRAYDVSANELEVLYKGAWIKLSTKDVMMGPKGLCSTESMCAISVGVTPLLKFPNTTTGQLGLAYQDQKMPVLGRKQLNKKIWVQVDLGDKIAWVEATKIKIESRACGLNQVGQSAWSGEVEMQGFNSRSINEFGNVYFYDTNQAPDTARDPIYRVTQISSANASISAVYAKGNHSVSAGVGYHKRVWSLRSLSEFRAINPNPPNDCMVQPGTENELVHEDTFVSVPLSYRYLLYKNKAHKIRMRPQLQVLYNLEPNFRYQFYSPCRVQQTAIETSNLFQVHGILNVDYLYELKGWELGLSFGIEHSMGLALSIILGF